MKKSIITTFFLVKSMLVVHRIVFEQIGKNIYVNRSLIAAIEIYYKMNKHQIVEPHPILPKPLIAIHFIYPFTI